MTMSEEPQWKQALLIASDLMAEHDELQHSRAEVLRMIVRSNLRTATFSEGPPQLIGLTLPEAKEAGIRNILRTHGAFWASRTYIAFWTVRARWHCYRLALEGWVYLGVQSSESNARVLFGNDHWAWVKEHRHLIKDYASWKALEHSDSEKRAKQIEHAIEAES